MRNDSWAEVIAGCFVALIFVLLVGSATALVLMLVWNGLLTKLFELPAIDFWMAWGISIVMNMVGATIRRK